MKPPILRDRRILAWIADGETQRLIARRDGNSIGRHGIAARVRHMRLAAKAPTTEALIALAVDEKWIVRTFEGWIVPDGGGPS